MPFQDNLISKINDISKNRPSLLFFMKPNFIKKAQKLDNYQGYVPRGTLIFTFLKHISLFILSKKESILNSKSQLLVKYDFFKMT